MSSEQNNAGRGMDWMYEGPSALVNREDYLLGRKVDKTFQMLEEVEKGNSAWLTEAEKDLTPQSVLKSTGRSGPIDVIRKIKDDPLYQIQKKEQEYRKQLLQNPILMKKLQDNKRIEGSGSGASTSTSSKTKKKKEKKRKHKKRSSSSSSSSSSSDEEVDKLLSKLKNSYDLSKLVSGSSSSKSKKSKRRHDSSSDSDNKPRKRHESPARRSEYRSRRDRSRSKSPSQSHRRGKERYESSTKTSHPSSSSRYSSASKSSDHKNTRQEAPSRQKVQLDEEEMERRRQEMMGNAKQRDVERERVVNKHREELKKEQEMLEDQKRKDKNAEFIRRQLVDAASSGSVEKRIKANSYNIQRSKFAMDQNFARR